MPGYPNMYIPFVDVRDVAAAHVLAMTTPRAAGQRFLLASGPAIPMKQVGDLLRSLARARPASARPAARTRNGQGTDKEHVDSVGRAEKGGCRMADQDLLAASALRREQRAANRYNHSRRVASYRVLRVTLSMRGHVR